MSKTNKFSVDELLKSGEEDSSVNALPSNTQVNPLSEFMKDYYQKLASNLPKLGSMDWFQQFGQPNWMSLNTEINEEAQKSSKKD